MVGVLLQRDASYHSNWADLGGFLCGLLPAALFLPCPSDTRSPDFGRAICYAYCASCVCHTGVAAELMQEHAAQHSHVQDSCLAACWCFAEDVSHDVLCLSLCQHMGGIYIGTELPCLTQVGHSERAAVWSREALWAVLHLWLLQGAQQRAC